MHITNASTRFATFGILGFFGFTVLSGKFRLDLHSRKRVMQALCAMSNRKFTLLFRVLLMLLVILGSKRGQILTSDIKTSMSAHGTLQIKPNLSS